MLKKRNVDMPADEDSDGGSNMQDMSSFGAQSTVSTIIHNLKFFFS